MSLLLKALKQAESAHAEKSSPAGEALELESLASHDATNAREWLEPPGMLFGSSGLTPTPPSSTRRFRMPHLSLIPATAFFAGMVAIGYGIYLYSALQPPDAMVPASVATTAITPAPIVATGAPVATTPPPPLDAVAAADLPTPSDFAATEAITARPKANPTSHPSMAYPKKQRFAGYAGSEPASAPTPSAFSFQPDTGTPPLKSAYDAYQNGQFDEAQRLYSQAAAHDRSVDALLGLAVIAGVRNRDEDAARLYREILDRDPRNAAAQAALLDLLGNTDRQATESRLKTLLERAPSANVYQSLGNLYAEQNRWADAQTAYFEAYRAAPDNADYAYNLAVSLDRLRQPQVAQGYYEKALNLGGTHRFERTQAESRIRQIKSLQLSE